MTDAHLDALAGGARRRPVGRRRPRSARAREPAFTHAAARRDWFAGLDAAGVPCEVSNPDFVLSLFDDPEMIEKGWVTSYEHPIVGRMDVSSASSSTCPTRPGVVHGPPLVPGQDTRAILAELGYDDEQHREVARVRGRRPIASFWRP